MICARAFFDIQLAFAQKAAALTRLSIERALLDYTNLYIRLGLGWDFDPGHASWRTYLEGLSKSDDAGEWTHQFYLESIGTAISHPVVATFGCFSYSRRADLRALFRNVLEESNPPSSVVGASWLYNLDAYRRLFPPSYLATTRPTGPHFQRMSLWDNSSIAATIRRAA